MNQLDELIEQLRVSVGRFLMDLQSSKYVDYAEYRNIESATRQLAELLKPEPLVPKAVLHQLNIFIKTVRAEAPYIGEKEADVQIMADNVRMTFDLILLGESHDDRRHGIMRII